MRDVTFCVVDLETTGGSPTAGCMITEIGAVKVRGGEVLGEFQTLVNPQTEIPAFIAVLTGITNSMVVDAPRIESVLPAFLEFAAGLRAGRPQRAVRRRLPAPLRRAAGPRVADVRGGRHRPARAPRHHPRRRAQLQALLARAVFNSATTPNHRALSDARATVDVLHGLMERLGGLGVHTLEELQTFTSRVSAAQRRKRHLAEGLPHSPGVYLFRDDQQRVLYVGTSRDLRTRVRSYFTASETRSRMGEMVNLATHVTGDRVRHPARGRGARAAADRRAQAALQPPLPLPREGPLPQAHPRGVAAAVAGAAGASTTTPTTSDRSPPGRPPSGAWRPSTTRSRSASAPTGSAPAAAGRACVLAEMGRCLSPCDGSADLSTYAAVVRQLRDSLMRRPDDVVDAINRRMGRLAESTSGSRRPASTATGSRPSSGPPPAPSGWPR